MSWRPHAAQLERPSPFFVAVAVFGHASISISTKKYQNVSFEDNLIRRGQTDNTSPQFYKEKLEIGEVAQIHQNHEL